MKDLQQSKKQSHFYSHLKLYHLLFGTISWLKHAEITSMIQVRKVSFNTKVPTAAQLKIELRSTARYWTPSERIFHSLAVMLLRLSSSWLLMMECLKEGIVRTFLTLSSKSSAVSQGHTPNIKLWLVWILLEVSY